MKKVVFVCHGNMLRSQIAKAIYNQLTKNDTFAESYGTHVVGQGYQGRKLSSFSKLEAVLTELKKQDLDIENEFCKQLEEKYFIDADKIIVMAEKEYLPKYLEKYKYEYWEIPNPEIYDDQILENIVFLIKQKVSEMI
jgi:protein-tyrosine-phosphatase